MPIREADPPHCLYRVGRASDPLAWPPAHVLGRYNDPDGTFRVLYAAAERCTAFLETLQDFRPALSDLALVEAGLRAGEIELPSPVGRVPPSYFSKLMVEFSVDNTQRWLDLRSVETHAV